MSRQKGKGVSFETPTEWCDRSIVAFQAPAEADATRPRSGASNIAVTREPMREGDTLRLHADRLLLELGRHLGDFDLLESRETELGGHPAIHMRYGWMSSLGSLEQSVTIVKRDEEAGPVVFTFTTTTTRDDAESARIVFARILASVEFEQVAPSTQRSAPSGLVPKPDAEMPYVPMPGISGLGRRR